MNFLQIAQRVRQECGISGAGPSAVSGQTGMYAKIIDWVLTAHEELQQSQFDWNFDWGRHTANLVAGTEAYSPVAAWSLPFKKLAQDGLYVYRTADGEQAKTWVELIDWAAFRQIRNPPTTGLPIYAALSPDKSLYFHPTPDAGLVAVLEYYKKPEVLVANLDVPRIPEEYHMAIVWRAVMFWCAHDENAALFQSANANYNRIKMQMMGTESPEMPSLETLA